MTTRRYPLTYDKRSADPGSAAAYIRVSSEEQAREGHSLDAQTRSIEERAEVDGRALDPARLYADRGIGGSREDKRPAYEAMLAAAAAGEFQVLYVWKFDRLGRDTEERMRAKRMLTAAGSTSSSSTGNGSSACGQSSLSRAAWRTS